MPVDRRFDEAEEQRVRVLRFRLEFRMELHGDEPGMVAKLDDLGELLVRIDAGDHEAGRLEVTLIVRVEFVAMAMPLADKRFAVAGCRARAFFEGTRLGSQPHRAPFVRHAPLLFEHADHGMRRPRFKFGAVGPGQLQHAAGELDHGALHAQADAEVGNFAVSRKATSLHFPLDAPHAEAAGDQNAVDARQERVGVLRLEFFGLNPLHDHAGRMGEAGMIEGFVDRFVRIAMVDVFADNGDRHFLLRMPDPVHQALPVVNPQRAG